MSSPAARGDRKFMVGPLVLAERDHAGMATFFAVGVAVAAVVLRLVGVPPVDLHGPLHYVGIMDPLCGGTRATFLLFTCDLTGVLRYNPGVPVLAAGVAILLVRAGLGAVTGRWVELSLSPWSRRILFGLVFAAVVVLAVRQQLHAELLTEQWPPTG